MREWACEARWISTTAPEMAAADNWTRSGSTLAWSSPTVVDQPTLLLVSTPMPWGFWLGLVVHDGREITPIALFKNAIPLFETTTAVLKESELDTQTWELAVDSCLFRNPGLRGLFDRVDHLCATGQLTGRSGPYEAQ